MVSYAFSGCSKRSLRDLGYKKYVGDSTAHQISTLILIVLFALYIGCIIHRFPPATSKQAILIGTVWIVLTLSFEFGFGRYQGNSWLALFADYNLMKGRIWLLVPVFVLLAPYIFYRVWK